MKNIKNQVWTSRNLKKTSKKTNKGAIKISYRVLTSPSIIT